MKTSGKSFIPEGNVPEWKRYFGLERTEVCLFELLQLIIFTIEIIRAEISSGLVIVDQIFSIRLA